MKKLIRFCFIFFMFLSIFFIGNVFAKGSNISIESIEVYESSDEDIWSENPKVEGFEYRQM